MGMVTFTAPELWGDPVRTNLVASGGTATEISFEANVDFVYISVPAGQEWKWCFAADASAAATVFSTGTAVGVITSGFPIPVRGRNQSGTLEKLYVLSTGSAVSNGLSYWKAALSGTTPA